MTLKQLEAFYWAATCASFAVAAERLHLSVSSLSKRIAELEDALGQPLFDRGGHKAVLTGAGQRLLPQARELLAAADRIRASLAETPGLRGRCRFGVGELTALTWLPRLIGVVRAAYPDLVLEPYVDIGQVLEQRVADGELDFAVIAGRSSRPNIASAPIGEAAFAWAAAPAALAGDTRMSPDLLARLPLVTLPAGAGTTRIVDDWLAGWPRRGRRTALLQQLGRHRRPADRGHRGGAAAQPLGAGVAGRGQPAGARLRSGAGGPAVFLPVPP